MESQHNPIFVVCHARSGSTLLRYVLDTHSQLACPPELHLPYVITQLIRINRLIYADNAAYADPQQLEEKALAEARRVIEGIMAKVCLESGKKLWCEKSISTVVHIGIIKRVFPRARFICLFRNCMDFVQSALQTGALGVGYGYEEYINSRDPHRTVDSLVKFWCEKTRDILTFRQANAGQCLQVKYESLVSDPELTSRAIFRFLQLPFEDDLLARVFKTRHLAGPGDHKIYNTTRIEKTSVGLGRNVPVEQIRPDTLKLMNHLLVTLGYDPVAAAENANLATRKC